MASPGTTCGLGVAGTGAGPEVEAVEVDVGEDSALRT